MEYLNNVLPFIHAEAEETVIENKEGGEGGKPTLTDDEKKKFNEVFRERYAELQEKARKDQAKALTDLETKMKADFAAELEKSKMGKSDDDNAEAKRIVADYKKAVEDRDKQLGLLNEKLAAKDKDIYGMRKDAAVTEAISGIPFVNLKQVKVLTGDAIELDPDSGKFVVRNENGEIVQGDDFKPLTLKEYYTKYAADNPHLVKSEVKTGVGSTTNASSGAVGKFAHVKSKADLAKDMKLRIAFINEKGLPAFEALPLK